MSEPTPSADLLISTIMLLLVFFQSINDHWGPHTVDRFACSYNSKLPRFNSQFFQPGCEAVDAFSQDWGYDNNWLCPPVRLIVRVLKHMEACLARGTLILPVWKSSFFWNVCATDGVCALEQIRY